MGNLIRAIKDNLAYNGLANTFQKAIQKIIGIGGLKDEVEVLQFLFSAYHDASAAPPATDPDLRILQLCNVQFLRIITKECERLGLTYWLDFGTLLGAVRHKGFIPWDDDMDIAMPRKDYNRALTELRDALSKYDVELNEDNQIGVGFKHNQTGVWCDIFAVDDYYYDGDYDVAEKKLRMAIPQCRRDYQRHKKHANVEWKAERRLKIIGGTEGQNRILYHQPEFQYEKDRIRAYEIVFPLSQVEFEGYTFNAPGNTDIYLKGCYGNNYMGFPKRGILHHDQGRGPLSTWAKKNGMDMQKVYEKLLGIYISLV